MTKIQTIQAEMAQLRREYLKKRAELEAELEDARFEYTAKLNASRKAKAEKDKPKQEREEAIRRNEEAMQRLKEKAEAMAKAKAAKAWVFASHPDRGGTAEEFRKAFQTWKYWEAAARS